MSAPLKHAPEGTADTVGAAALGVVLGAVALGPGAPAGDAPDPQAANSVAAVVAARTRRK